MTLAFAGQLQISDTQATAMASQLNQALFAQGTTAQEHDPAKGH
jgi:hypothetical protein